MKITRRQLRSLIREALLCEQQIPTPSDVLQFSKLAHWMSVNPERRGQAMNSLEILFQVDETKRAANIKGLDKYFHYLGFCSAASYLKDKGWPKSYATEFLVDDFGLGEIKELVDSLNPLSPTSVWRSGKAAALSEWQKDMASNKEGVRSAYGSGTTCCDGALDYAKASGSATVRDLIDDPSRWPGFEENYGDAIIKYRDVYGDDDIFIQPRFHCSLTDLERTFRQKLADISGNYESEYDPEEETDVLDAIRDIERRLPEFQPTEKKTMKRGHRMPIPKKF